MLYSEQSLMEFVNDLALVERITFDGDAGFIEVHSVFTRFSEEDSGFCAVFNGNVWAIGFCEAGLHDGLSEGSEIVFELLEEILLIAF